MDDPNRIKTEMAISAQAERSRDAALRNVIDILNEHTVFLSALMKKLNTTPDELLDLVKSTHVIISDEKGN